jgi:sulfite exporter TauE/SafE
MAVGPLLFVGGKLAAYSLLGLLAGWIGATLIGTGLVGRTTAVVSVAGGILMLAAILLTRVRFFKSGGAGLSVFLARTAHRFGTRAPLILGISAALLPCGLLYAMVARSAAAGSAVQGMTLMQAFGLGTTPALLGLGILLRSIPQRWSKLGSVAGEVIIIVTALVLIWRGIGGLTAGAAGPSCCE